MRRATIVSTIVMLLGASGALSSCTSAEKAAACKQAPHHCQGTNTLETPVPPRPFWGCTTATSGDQSVGDPHHKSWRGITWSNGSNTYLNNDVFDASPGTTQKICGNPGNWTASTRTVRDDGGAVQSYPAVNQLVDDVPIRSLHSLTSTYHLVNPPASGTWEAAYDLWFHNNKGFEGDSDAMIWVYNVHRGTGGARVKGHANIDGHAITYETNGKEQILSFDKNEPSGTIDVLAFIKYLELVGAVSKNATVSAVDWGMEICETGGKTLGFSATRFSLRAS